MRAILFDKAGPPEVMYLGETEDLHPQENYILVKVAATALNRADTLQRQGKYPPPPGESPILGLEMAGTVAALGPSVTQWKIGDRVCGLLGGGGYAEYALIHEKMAMPIPDAWNFEQAAAMPEVFLTAFQALNWLAGLQAGEDVLIHAGASGVGTAGIQIAKEMGAQVFVTASQAKHDICLELGATVAINYREQDFAEAILSLTSGKGVQVILDFIAAPYFHQNVKALSTDGRLILLALMGGAKVGESLNLAHFLRKRISLIGTTLRARSLSYKIRLTQDFWDFAANKFAENRLKPIVDTTFDWKDAAKAHAYMEANKNQGKIVLKIT